MRKTPLKSARRRGLWKWGQGIRLAHSPTAEQNQKKRTNHLLPKPDKFIRYRQKMLNLLHTTRHGRMASPRRDPILPSGAWVPRGRRADATAPLTKPAHDESAKAPPQ